jgi:tryptophan 2,3-dioxygenase
MKKIYIVRLTDEERQICHAIVKKLKGTSQKVRRANILLKADVDGQNWKDNDIADAFFCTTQTVENVRKKLVTEGFEIALNGKKRETPPRQKLLDGKQEAQVIALRLSNPPEGRNAWTLRLLAEKIVELEIAPTISRTTVQQTLKKIKLQKEKCNTG